MNPPPPPTAPVQQSTAATPLNADYPPAYAEAGAPPYPSSQDPAVDVYQNVANETMGIYNVVWILQFFFALFPLHLLEFCAPSSTNGMNVVFMSFHPTIGKWKQARFFFLL